MLQRRWAVLILSLVAGTTGCFRHVRTVQITKAPPQVLGASLDELLKQTDDRYKAVKTMTASVEIAASTGGGKQGRVVDYTSFSGHILMRKPADLRVVMLVPVLHTTAVDMVTDGKTFKLVIPPKKKAVTGSNELTTRSPNALENLRPSDFFDSLFVRGLQPDELITLTTDERIYQPDPKKKELVAEPDYDLSIMRRKNNGQELQTMRVIHIGRSTLLPYQQDIFDSKGAMITQALYESYQKFGEIDFPTKITMKKPLDQLSMVVTISNLNLNQEMEDDQFELKIPENIPVKKLP